MEKGALAAIGIGWYRSGFEAAKLASRVLRGERPGSIPMVNVVEKKLVLNQTVARKLGISSLRHCVRKPRNSTGGERAYASKPASPL